MADSIRDVDSEIPATEGWGKPPPEKGGASRHPSPQLKPPTERGPEASCGTPRPCVALTITIIIIIVNIILIIIRLGLVLVLVLVRLKIFVVLRMNSSKIMHDGLAAFSSSSSTMPTTVAPFRFAIALAFIDAKSLLFLISFHRD